MNFNAKAQRSEAGLARKGAKKFQVKRNTNDKAGAGSGATQSGRSPARAAKVIHASGPGDPSKKTNRPGSNAVANAPSAGANTSAPESLTRALTSPRDLLLPYQRRWADDESRFKIGLQARQTGKDFASGEEGVRDCYRAELAGGKAGWMIAAPSERQSLESLEKWKEWAAAYKLAIADAVEVREGKGSETLLKSATIVFPNGSRVVAVPGKPDTVRGFSMNLLITEFAFLEDPDRTWRAALPSITNPLRGGAKKVRLISTPNGQGNKFHSLWAKNFGKSAAEIAKASEAIVPAHVRERIEEAIAEAHRRDAKSAEKGLTLKEAQMVWSCHRVNIYEAVKQGLPVNLFELYAGMDDAEGWAQEFECEFLDAAAVLLPYELLALCESAEASDAVPFEYWAPSGAATRQFPVDLGIDFGRKRDLTVCWAAEAVADLQITKEVLCLERMSTPDQVDVLRPRIQKARRACLDYTGPGIGMGDYLVKEFGEWKPEENKFGKIELVTFTNAMKVELFSKLRMAYERRAWRTPINRVIREDLHSIYRVVTSAGNVTYRAPHAEDGHADRATGQALCTRAGSVPGGASMIIVPGGRRAEIIRDRRERSVAG